MPSNFKAFVSSTYEDLKNHRAYVIRALRKAGIFVDPMEDWTAGSQEPTEFSQQRVEGCDLCVLIVSFKRGFVPDGETLSVTQLEHRYAMNHGIDVLAFVLHDDADWKARFDERRDDPAIEQWRRELVKMYGVGQFTLDPRSVEIESAIARWLQQKGGQTAAAPVISRQVPVVPKGLRSFDEEDQDFYLQLVPGPRDKDGLPDSIRFWKHRIEQTAPNELTVGLIWGPSGCGKTSLVKAGLLPRLPEHVLPVYLEASAEETERNLRSRLRGVCPEIPSDAVSIVDTLSALSRGQGIPEGKKVVIILDQFEQWLHGRPIDGQTDLIQALRQCDGRHVQCIVMVRDDFWTAVYRFMDLLNIEVRDGYTATLVDLFDQEHARKVLTSFGAAHHPPRIRDGDAKAIEFVDKAVAELAGPHGEVVAVRLALFFEMAKSRKWEPETLKTVGGARGIGVLFLEEILGDQTSHPTLQRKGNAEAAKSILRALIPNVGSDIKGARRSRDELFEAACYTGLPSQFDELLRCLEVDVRLIRSADHENDVSDKGVKHYQLTHDYLVRSIRQWLHRKQEQTRRGRAELLLDGRARVWNDQPEVRHLPSWWEVMKIRLFTDKRNWTDEQNAMMRRATRHHGLRGCMLALVLLALYIWRAETAFNLVVTAKDDTLSSHVRHLGWFRPWVVPRLKLESMRTPNTDATTGQKLRLMKRQGNARFALLWLRSWENELFKSSSDPTVRSYLINHINQSRSVELYRRLCRRLLTEEDASIRYALVLALEEYDHIDDISDDVRSDLKNLYRVEKDSGVHSALHWLLDKSFPEEPTNVGSTGSHRSWYVNREGHTMVTLEGGEFQMGSPPDEPGRKHDLNQSPRYIDWRFSISAREVTRHQFRTFLQDWETRICPECRQCSVCPPHEKYRTLSREQFTKERDNYSPHDSCPIIDLTWYEAVAYCNWLSAQEKLPSEQWCYEPNEDEKYARGMKVKNGYLALKGYRLPTEAEWEYACRAGTESAYSFGSDQELLADYGHSEENVGLRYNVKERTGLVGELRPNEFGLFGMHGNAWELCQTTYRGDGIAGTDDGGVVRCADSRIFKGGSYSHEAEDHRSANRYGYAPCHRGNDIGFRVARTLSSGER